MLAYKYANGSWTRETGKEFNLNMGSDWSLGIWSDGVTMWVSNNTHDKVFAYTLATKMPDTSKEFNTHLDNGTPVGLWSDGETIWVGDGSDDKVYAYYMRGVGGLVPDKELSVTGITGTSATLRLVNHDGAWAYKSTTTGHASCVSVTSGTYTKNVTGLTPGATYTFTAYSDSGCSNVIDDAPAFTTLGYGDRNASGDIILARLGSQVWSDGTTVWLSFFGSLEAYKKSDGTRDASKDIGIGGLDDPIFTGDGTTVWTLPGHVDHDDGDDGHSHGPTEPATSILAYSISGKARDADKDITLAGDQPGRHGDGHGRGDPLGGGPPTTPRCTPTPWPAGPGPLAGSSPSTRTTACPEECGPTAHSSGCWTATTARPTPTT